MSQPAAAAAGAGGGGAGAAAGSAATKHGLLWKTGAAAGGVCHCAGNVLWSAMCCTGCMVISLGVGMGVAMSGGKKMGLEYTMRGRKCGECDESLATIACFDCGEAFCFKCCSRIHSKGYRSEHRGFKQLPDTEYYAADQLCGNCQKYTAEWFCDECTEVYCLPCRVRVHQKGYRQLHKRIWPIGNRAGVEEPENHKGIVPRVLLQAKAGHAKFAEESFHEDKSCEQLQKSVREQKAVGPKELNLARKMSASSILSSLEAAVPPPPPPLSVEEVEEREIRIAKKAKAARQKKRAAAAAARMEEDPATQFAEEEGAWEGGAGEGAAEGPAETV